MVRLPLALAGTAVLLWLRRDVVVRAIRTVDRRGGLASDHGERAYARAAGLFGALHRLAVEEAVRTVRAGDTVVDIGSGPGGLLAELGARAPGLDLLGIEPSATMRDVAAARGVIAIEGQAEALPLGDASVDLVLSTLSAHHWDDPAVAFAEIARVLRPGGEARIYDVRFAGYGAREAVTIATAAGLDPAGLRHDVTPARTLGLRLYARLTIRPPAPGNPMGADRPGTGPGAGTDAVRRGDHGPIGLAGLR